MKEIYHTHYTLDVQCVSHVYCCESDTIAICSKNSPLPPRDAGIIERLTTTKQSHVVKSSQKPHLLAHITLLNFRNLNGKSNYNKYRSQN